MSERDALTTTPIVPVPCLPPDLRLPVGFLAEVREAYQHPPRAYHHWGHVTRVLEHVGDVAEDLGWTQPREVWLAGVFHDVVYVPGARDNELRSAVMSRASIARWFPAEPIDTERVSALIRLTASHTSLTPEMVDRDEGLFLDCDTAILGAPVEEFDRYDDGIAQEYAGVVSPEAYRAGRRAFLERLMAAPRIFLSDHFHELYDRVARANLERAIARLS